MSAMRNKRATLSSGSLIAHCRGVQGKGVKRCRPKGCAVANPACRSRRQFFGTVCFYIVTQYNSTSIRYFINFLSAMKYNIGFLIIALLAIACNPHSEERFSIQGEIFGSTDGEMICLSHPIQRDGIWYKQCDTTYINGGHFCFDGMVDGIAPAELSFQNMDFAQLFIEPSEIQFSAERNSLYSYSISGLRIKSELDE